MNQLSRGTHGGRHFVLDCHDKVIAAAIVFAEEAKTEPEKGMLPQKLDSLDERHIHMREFVHGI